MLSKCASCFRTLGWKLLGHSVPKWYSHFRNFCESHAQKQQWCNMFIDNLDQIFDFNLSKDIEHQIRNTNIASEIVKIINHHYSEDNNLFKFCIELFGSYLKLKYSETINPSNNTLNRMANQHQEFTKLIIDLFVLYYGLQDRQIVGQQLFYKSTLPSLAVTLIFQNQDTNNTVLRIAKLAFKNKIDKIQFQIQRYSNHPINQFVVSPELCLNEYTLNYFKVKSENCQDVPYSGAIQIIKQIIRVKSPSEKMRLAEGISKQIQSSALQFYKKYGISCEKVELTSENITNIFLFLMIQANQPTFLAHIQIAKLFSPQNARGHIMLENILSASQTLEKGPLSRRQSSSMSTDLQESQLIKKNEIVSGFFDEVSNFDL